jgi:hypothetical protein
MDLEVAAKKLRTAQKAIAAALEAIEAAAAPHVQGECKFCNEPILETDDVTREIHNRCYLAALRMIKDEKTTWEKLESEGLVGPPGKSGRKSNNPRLKEIYDKLDAAAETLPKPPKK